MLQRIFVEIEFDNYDSLLKVAITSNYFLVKSHTIKFKVIVCCSLER
ncbi:hypothetical protein HanXRQr2_Chr10g0459901 [Helianthus annuus]|uniref:Uncharacterized protein n=1 Tax=Helianthus annuus TaxID=4232 RepID=A0A9K3I0U7_HELAN|nr:hypothetical protein HanXRQr2_Chr10g0459901 [Helianthus annuus]